MSLRAGTTYACFDVIYGRRTVVIPAPLKKNGEPPTVEEFRTKYEKTHIIPDAVCKSDPFLITKGR